MISSAELEGRLAETRHGSRTPRPPPAGIPAT
jgi:hypothetical protein